MNKQTTLTQANLDDLLSWLDYDRESAGRKYEQIRHGLIKLFAARGCHHAEELADETLTRVASKAAALKGNYEGNPSLYFYGVAKNVHREYLREMSRGGDVSPILQSSQYGVAPVADGLTSSPDEVRLRCLTQCLLSLHFEEREFVTKYYEEEKRAKIDSRRALAERHGLSINALRLKAHRLRRSLKQCLLTCMESNP
jgi:DNA-directed RNA polymerase specialized sigma24 family protein